MKNLQLFQWIRIQVINLKSSIAFYPALIALGFLLLSFLILRLEQIDVIAGIKSSWPILDFRDASTARTIVGTIAAGVISLTVFSFSMVMIVLNQAASNMTNRLLDLMINNRFQQVTLGVYIGTIVYALFLFTRISEQADALPGISIFLLMVMTVVDIFLFIYFLHYITQAVKIDTNIRRVARETMHALKEHFPDKKEEVKQNTASPDEGGMDVMARVSGYFQSYRSAELVKICRKLDCQVEILIHPGQFILEGMPVMKLFGKKDPEDEEIKGFLSNLDFYDKQDIASVPFWGFHQLMEIALKALSPGINDPVSAVRSMNKMAELLRYRLLHATLGVFEDEDGEARLFFEERSAENIVYHCLLPIWDYGLNDRQVVEAMISITKELLPLCTDGKEKSIIHKLNTKAKEQLEKIKL